MNSIIKWIATYNTLMIQIGFSAVVLLLVVYAFREFFVPKIKVVEAAQKTPEEIAAAEADALKKSIEGNSADRVAEIEKFKSEIDKLKNQLVESEVQIADLKNKVLEGPSTPSATEASPEKNRGSIDEAPPSSSADVKTVAAPAAATDSAVSAELTEKIQTLEARLAEYEIIAEDIAELSQLRKENDELKQKLAGGSIAADVSSDVPSIEAEKKDEPPPATEESLESTELDDYLKSTESESAKPSEELIVAEEPAVDVEKNIMTESADKIKLDSSKPVTETEKELIDQFDQSSTKKESS